MTFLTMFRRKSKPSTELSTFVYPHGTAEHHHSHLHHQLEVIGDKIFHLFHDQQKNKIEVKQGLKRDANEASLTNVEPAAKNETTSGEPLLFFLINNIAKSLLDLPHSQFCESNIKFEDEEKYDELDSSELNCFHAQGKHLRMDISLYINRLVKLSNKWSDDQRTGSESTGIRCAIMALFYLEKAKVVLSADSVHRYFAIAFRSRIHKILQTLFKAQYMSILRFHLCSRTRRKTSLYSSESTKSSHPSCWHKAISIRFKSVTEIPEIISH